MDVFSEKVVVVERSVFATRMQAARKKAGLTQGEVAEALGKEAHTTVTNWEQDRARPSLEDFVLVCQLYCITPNDILVE